MEWKIEVAGLEGGARIGWGTEGVPMKWGTEGAPMDWGTEGAGMYRGTERVIEVNLDWETEVACRSRAAKKKITHQQK